MYKLYVNTVKDINEGDYILIKYKSIQGEMIECDFEIFENNCFIEKVEGFLCYFNFLEKIFLNIDLIRVDQSNNLDFFIRFSILKDIYEYNKIRSLINFKKILKAINDISYLNIFDKSRMDYFKDTDFFINKFLGKKERLKAYGNGFNGFNKLANFEGIYVEIHNGAKISFGINKNYNSLLPYNIYSIVGKNGLGKSIALKEVYTRYTNNFNKIQVFSTDIISQSYFKNYAKNNDTYINVSKNSNFNYLISELLLFRGENLSSMLFFLLADVFSDERYHNVFISRLPFNEKLSLKKFFENLGKGSFFNETDFSKMSLTRIIKGRKYSLSSGEKVILNIILNMSLVILKSGGENLFMFDEPENHLHPNFISQLMSFINKILYASNSYAVIATHSPFVIKSLLKENIVVLKQKTDLVVAEKITFNTLGANVETISQFVFGNNDLMELEREVIKELVDRYGKDYNFDENKIIEELSNNLSPELVLEIIRSLGE